jgi:hypothetical protein
MARVDPSAETQALVPDAKIRTTIGTATTVIGSVVTVVATTVICWMSLSQQVSVLGAELQRLRIEHDEDHARLSEIWYKSK